MIEDDAIQGVLASAADPGAATQHLIDLANEAGGHDNITTVVIDITGYYLCPNIPPLSTTCKTDQTKQKRPPIEGWPLCLSTLSLER